MSNSNSPVRHSSSFNLEMAAMIVCGIAGMIAAYFGG